MRDEIRSILTHARARDLQEMRECGFDIETVVTSFAVPWIAGRVFSHEARPTAVLAFQEITPRALVIAMFATDEWSHAATATNFGVVWNIQALAFSDGDDMDGAAFPAAVAVTDTGGQTSRLYRSTETSAVTIGGSPAENDVVAFQASREASNGADTMAIDARLHGVALFYTTNSNTDI